MPSRNTIAGVKAAVDTLIRKYVPSKVLRGKKNLPWVTREIKRMMNKRDRLYQVQKRTSNENDRCQFKKAKYTYTLSKLKTAYNSYLDSVVGTSDDEENDIRPESKTLFSYLKNCRQNSQGTAPLSLDGQLHTDNVKKANKLNNQFQSVFTPKSPLKLQQLLLNMYIISRTLVHSLLATFQQNCIAYMKTCLTIPFQ